ncbi:GntR family transcriptional regulator [Herbiconiux moechotypicola]|uniref:GntR family transcriptional regulator n=1 Tax=Herbiconiux moechotypicola TaxID=637393 RepID=A0ABP5QS94_9MICO|nr:GntR family transcriptional regulator [Herbiconiux moechotypicola]MCS5730596.1 GntR family transcriptional regulator [Herbiconiux moechotypicola]
MTAELSETVHERVRDWLRDAIQTGALAPGSKVVQTEVAERLGVSATPVREAMRDLHAEGLLTLVPRRGAIVRMTDPGDMAEIRRLCELLEPELARLTALHITDDELAAAWRIQAEMERADDQGFLRLNREFHYFLYDCGRSPRLATILRNLHDATPAYLPFAFARLAERRTEGLAEHIALLHACTRHDADEAARLITEHWRPVFDEVARGAHPAG